MSFTFAGYRCLDPLEVREGCQPRDRNPSNWLPTDAFWGLANSFSNPLGGKPGTGTLLLSRQVIDRLKFGGPGDKFLPLELTMLDGTTRKAPKVLVTGHAEAVTPGIDPADPRTAYVVSIADRRWLEWERGEPLFQGYNLRTDRDASYIAATLNGGTAWTWQEMIDDLWPASLGTAPTLPFTPHGTPEMFWFVGVTKLWAVDHVLTRLACALRYDQFRDTFTIVRLGSAATPLADVTLKRYASARRTDAYPKVTRTAALPEKIRVRFRQKIPKSDGTPSYVTHDATVSPAAGELAVGTFVLLNDDLIAQSADGSTISNTATLEARRDERATDWIRKRSYFDTGDLRQYVGFLPLHDAIGARWKDVVWKDVGNGPQTELGASSLRDRTLEAWDFDHDTLPDTDEGGGTGSASFSGARVTHSVDQVIGGGIVLDFDTEEFDTDAYHDVSTDNDRLTVPTTGYYLVGYELWIIPDGGGGTFPAAKTTILLNNSSVAHRCVIWAPEALASTTPFSIMASTLLYLSANDFVSLGVEGVDLFSVDNGSTTNPSPVFWITRIGG